VSQWEREAIGERTSAAMQHKRSKGELVGAVPFGFGVGPDGKTLVANEAEQLVVAAVREYRAGGLSLRTIGKRLAERGMLPRQGGTWHAAQIQRIAEAA
jgi:DNA invertase Pin-like site-specific DNA recombinase